MHRTPGSTVTQHRIKSQHRLDRGQAPTLNAWKPQRSGDGATLPENVAIECGWGRLLFGHTFRSNEELANSLREETDGRRDIAMYIGNPHVLLALAPQELFLDPSHTYRIYLEQYRHRDVAPPPFTIRKLLSPADIDAVNGIYGQRGMVPLDANTVWESRTSRVLTHFVAIDESTKAVIGTVTGVDHREAFGDPENGCSLWALAVDSQATLPGVGRALTSQLIEHYIARGRSFLDLSVMHDNTQAIALYENLGFMRVPVFCVKRKNPFNEPLFIGTPGPEQELNPYAAIIVREARKRGIAVEVLDAEAGYFALSLGGRTLVCRESLSELTSAIAMSRCDDKRVTRRVLLQAGLNVPAQRVASGDEGDLEFLRLYGRVVVKPTRGEQGKGVRVGITTADELAGVVSEGRHRGDTVLVEEMVEGDDLRIIVINYRVVAAAIRRPPEILGTGEHSVRRLIQKQSRRRAAATGGESTIPLDRETERKVQGQGYGLDDILAVGQRLVVRGAANLHAGGTIHDVTADIHPRLVQAAERAAVALNIPVVGLDFMVPSIDQPRYWIIEANERPGLANHEPQPTAEAFIDLLFPDTASA